MRQRRSFIETKIETHSKVNLPIQTDYILTKPLKSKTKKKYLKLLQLWDKNIYISVALYGSCSKCEKAKDARSSILKGDMVKSVC